METQEVQERYRRGLLAHAESIRETLEAVSPETAAFMRNQFALHLYPIEWIREFSAALEKFRRS